MEKEKKGKQKRKMGKNVKYGKREGDGKEKEGTGVKEKGKKEKTKENKKTQKNVETDRKLHLIRTEGLKASVFVCTSNCSVIVNNRCEFQHSSSHADCTFNARLVSKKRKDPQKSNNSMHQACPTTAWS